MALKFAVNNSLSAITSLPSGISGGALNLISTQTASASASIEFTTGIDSTYDVYCFKFINCHPATDGADFQFNFSTDSGSNYNVTKTTTYFRTYHYENDTGNDFEYRTGEDLAQSTSDQIIFNSLGSDNDQSSSGEIYLYNPSSTTFVKHFLLKTNCSGTGDYTWNAYIAGYGNTTSAINAVRFKMDSGNIDDGIIKMYGVS
jgi:hypothetical protein